MSRTSFRVNLHSIVCLNVKELLARSRRHIWSLSHSMAKWLSVRLRIKWLWVQIPLLSLKIIIFDQVFKIESFFFSTMKKKFQTCLSILISAIKFKACVRFFLPYFFFFFFPPHDSPPKTMTSVFYFI